MGFADHHSFYGRYINKDHPAVPVERARELEDAYNEANYKLQSAQASIQRSHEILDNLGVPRFQDNGLDYSIVGRLNKLLELSGK